MPSPTPPLNQSLTNEVVRAGAGAGKTTRLTQKVVEVASNHFKVHGRFPRMILTTFTRKATQEIRERLMQLALKDDNDALFDYVNSTSKLHISTIHGVLSQFLSSYGGRIGLNPNYSIISSSQNQKRIKAQLRESMIIVPQAQDFLETFTFGQLCGLAEKYYELWATHKVSAVTEADFLEVSQGRARAMAQLCSEVVTELAGVEIEGSWLEWKGRLRSIEQALLEKNFVEARKLTLSELEQMGTKPRRSKKNPVLESTDEKLKQVLASLKELKELRYDPEAWTTYISVTRSLSGLMEHFCQSFESQKIIDGELVMGDLELLAFSLLRDAPEAAASFSSEWDYWFIDEYQDTSPQQVKLLDALASKAPAFVVGDPQQSIYLFRGARSEVFSDREERVQKLGGHHSQLMKNYRSRPELLEFFNDYFTSYSSQFSAMEPRDAPDSEGLQVVAEILVSEAGTSADEESEEIAEKNGHPPAEVRAIVQRVQELMRIEGEPSQIAVLGRTNRQLEQVADYARDLGIPYQLHSASGFYQRLEIKDALALLKFMLNPHDNTNLIRLLRTPWFHLPDDQIAAVTLKTKEHSYWRAFELEQSKEPVVEALRELRQSASSVGLSESFRRALIDRMVFDASDMYDPSGRRESNLWKLLAKIKEEEQQEGFSYLEFVNRVEGPGFLARLDDESDAVPVIEPNKVNLMTVHASKGLQFNHVIIGFMGKNPLKRGGDLFACSPETGKWCVSLPDPETMTLKSSLMAEEWRNTLQDRETLEQERLLYVAMTRAKESVTLSWASPVGKSSWAAHCPFSTELGEHSKRSYRYRVRQEDWVGQSQLKATEDQIQVREPYVAERAEASKLQLSVTDVAATYDEGTVCQDTSPQDDSSAAAPKEVDIDLQLGYFEAVEQGVRLHTLFELLRYTDEDRWKELVCHHFPQEEDKAFRAIRYLTSLTEPDISFILKQGHAEWAFVCEVDGVSLQGQIDLWGRDRSGRLCLIDYKTGSSRYMKRAFDQLELYLVGLNCMGRADASEEVSLIVIYPFEEKIKVQHYKDSKELIQLWKQRLLSL